MGLWQRNFEGNALAGGQTATVAVDYVSAAAVAVVAFHGLDHVPLAALNNYKKRMVKNANKYKSCTLIRSIRKFHADWNPYTLSKDGYPTFLLVSTWKSNLGSER